MLVCFKCDREACTNLDAASPNCHFQLGKTIFSVGAWKKEERLGEKWTKVADVSCFSLSFSYLLTHCGSLTSYTHCGYLVKNSAKWAALSSSCCCLGDADGGGQVSNKNKWIPRGEKTQSDDWLGLTPRCFPGSGPGLDHTHSHTHSHNSHGSHTQLVPGLNLFNREKGRSCPTIVIVPTKL